LEDTPDTRRGLDSARFTVSFGSSTLSFKIGTVKVLLATLALNVRVPAVAR